MQGFLHLTPRKSIATLIGLKEIEFSTNTYINMWMNYQNISNSTSILSWNYFELSWLIISFSLAILHGSNILGQPWAHHVPVSMLCYSLAGLNVKTSQSNIKINVVTWNKTVVKDPFSITNYYSLEQNIVDPRINQEIYLKYWRFCLKYIIKSIMTTNT